MFALVLALLALVTHSTGYEDPPVFRARPTKTYVGKVGETIKLFCQVTEITKYKWYKDGKEITSDNRTKYGIKRFSSLKIKNLILADQGTYQCKASNTAGEITATMTLTVTGALEHPPKEGVPEFTNKIMSKVISKPLGGTAKLDCSATGNPMPKIVWKKNMQTLNNLNRGSYNVPMNITASTFVLKLNDVRLEDRGEYTCMVWNKHGNISFQFELDVKERLIAKPRLPATMRNFTAMVGQNATLECKSLSDPLQHYQWQRWFTVNGTEQSETIDTSHHRKKNKKHFIMSKPRQDGMSWHESYLLITNVSMKDAGKYTCTVGNFLGKSKGDMYLTVFNPTTAPAVVNPTRPVKESLTLMYVVIGVLVTFLVFVSALFYQFFKRNRSCSKDENSVELTATDDSRPRSSFSNNSSFSGSSYRSSYRKRLSSNVTQISTLSDLAPIYDEEWEIFRPNITLKHSIGEGAFGQVMLAETYGLPGHSAIKNVAVKMLKPEVTEGDFSDFILELEVMKNIGRHKNIVNLIGACTQDGPLWVVVEYCLHGNLRDYLRSRRPWEYSGEEYATEPPPTALQLISFAYQVAKGMEYLSTNKCIHRDLAARNILIDEELTVKISDFGLARDVHCHDYYRKTTSGLLPVKWMAVEALFDNVYTCQSDVWSFGIVLWEISTFGASPYPGIPMERLFELLNTGYRMEKPTNCLDEMYELMEHCWEEKPANRPTFTQLVHQLDHMLSKSTDKEYLDLDMMMIAPPLPSPTSTEVSTTLEDPLLEESQSLQSELMKNCNDEQESINLSTSYTKNSKDKELLKNCNLSYKKMGQTRNPRTSSDSGMEEGSWDEKGMIRNISETSQESYISLQESTDSSFSNVIDTDVWVPMEHKRVCRTFSPTGKDLNVDSSDAFNWWQTPGYISMISGSCDYLKPDDHLTVDEVGRSSKV